MNNSKNWLYVGIFAFALLFGAIVYTNIKLTREIKNSDNSQYVIDTLSQKIDDTINR